jgi:hypothetical protein
VRNNHCVTVSDLLPQIPPETDPAAGPISRKQERSRARERRRRGRGPLVAGFVVVVAAAGGSTAALLSDPDGRSAGAGVAAFPAGRGAAPSSSQTAVSIDALAPASQGQDTTQDAAREAALPSKINQVSGRPTRSGDAWPALTYTLEASASTEEPPRFPGAIRGFTLQGHGAGRVRLTPGRYFSPVGQLPVSTGTYDACRERRFYTRWMSLDPDAAVQATFVDQRVRTVQNTPVTGAAGWQSSYGCVQPALRLDPDRASAESGVVVLVETQIWYRR